MLQSLAATQPQDRPSKKRKAQNQEDFSAGGKGLKKRAKQVDADDDDEPVEPEGDEPVDDDDEVEDQQEEEEVEEEEETTLDNEANNPFFDKHFGAPDEDELAQRLKRIEANEWATKKLDAGTGKAGNPWKAQQSAHNNMERASCKSPARTRRR